MFNATQRDQIEAALLKRAGRKGTAVRHAALLRRAANNRGLFDRLIDAKAAELRKANPKATDGAILKMLLDWITNGGLASLIALIVSLLPK